MKKDIHPNYTETKVTCSCGNTFMTRSTAGKELRPEICSACHPFYTGKQKAVDTLGRVGRFQEKYAQKAPAAPKADKAPAAKDAPKAKATKAKTTAAKAAPKKAASKKDAASE